MTTSTTHKTARTPPPATTPSFEKSAKPLLLALKPSRCWRVFFYTLHILCIVALFLTAISVWLKLLLAVLIAVSFIYQQHQHNNQTQLVWRNGNRWFVDDEQDPFELTAIDFFSRWLVILSLTPTDKNAGLIARLRSRRKFVIPFDSLDENTFRLLRVRLRIEGFELLNPTEEVIR